MEDRFIIQSGEMQRTDYYHVVDTKTGKTLYQQWAGRYEDLQPIVRMLNELDKMVRESLAPLE